MFLEIYSATKNALKVEDLDLLFRQQKKKRKKGTTFFRSKQFLELHDELWLTGKFLAWPIGSRRNES